MASALKFVIICDQDTTSILGVEKMNEQKVSTQIAGGYSPNQDRSWRVGYYILSAGLGILFLVVLALGILAWQVGLQSNFDFAMLLMIHIRTLNTFGFWLLALWLGVIIIFWTASPKNTNWGSLLVGILFLLKLYASEN